MFCQKGQITESENNVCGKACHEPNLVKAGSTMTSNQAAHGFIQSDVEKKPSSMEKVQLLWPTNPEQQSAKSYNRKCNN